MHIKKASILEHAIGANVLVPVDAHTPYESTILTNVEAYLWNHTDGEIDTDYLEDSLTQEYVMSRQKAKEEVEKFILDLQKKGIIV